MTLEPARPVGGRNRPWRLPSGPARRYSSRHGSDIGVQAEHIIASLAKGTRVIVVGTFRTRTWTTSDGQERSTLEVLAEEIGPSLRWATTQVTRLTAR